MEVRDPEKVLQRFISGGSIYMRMGGLRVEDYDTDAGLVLCEDGELYTADIDDFVVIPRFSPRLLPCKVLKKEKRSE